jgi:hypothetical protein
VAQPTEKRIARPVSGANRKFRLFRNKLHLPSHIMLLFVTMETYYGKEKLQRIREFMGNEAGGLHRSASTAPRPPWPRDVGRAVP